MFLKIIIFIHILSATVWTGGHLILSFTFLPKALKQNNFNILETFESKYERIGIPALILLVITGIYMATQYSPDLLLFNFTNHYTKHIALKFILLFTTILLALHARLVLIPKKNLKPLSYHIIAVTSIAVAFVFIGFSARSGGLL